MRLAYPEDDRDRPVHADLRSVARVETDRVPWQGSPAEGVLRKRLELRWQEDIAEGHRVHGPALEGGGPLLTSLVQFLPGSEFPEHVHDGGEEILVLAGTFSDQFGHHGAGAYLRNPPGSRHAPWSREGCTLFVKLRQFAPGDRERVLVDTTTAPWQPGFGEGVTVVPLHRCGEECVSLVHLGPGARLPPEPPLGGREMLVLDGRLDDPHGAHPAGTWLRYPVGPYAGAWSELGCTLYLKVGHLAPHGAAVQPRPNRPAECGA